MRNHRSSDEWDTADDLPDALNRGTDEEARLIGIRDDVAEYWNVAGESVTRLHPDGEQEQFAHEEDTVEEYILAVENEHDESWRNLTELGRFLRAAAPFKGERVLTHRMTQVFAMRRRLNIPRSRVADLLGLSPNTVDNHLTTANALLNNAAGLAAVVYE